jgi:hypothetical protein
MRGRRTGSLSECPRYSCKGRCLPVYLFSIGHHPFSIRPSTYIQLLLGVYIDYFLREDKQSQDKMYPYRSCPKTAPQLNYNFDTHIIVIELYIIYM